MQMSMLHRGIGQRIENDTHGYEMNRLYQYRDMEILGEK